MLPPITLLDGGVLLCRVFRYHRWVPVSARAGLVAGARVWDWELICETGCSNRATEWLDDFGFRLPGTRRQYRPTDEWRQSAGFAHNELVTELVRRQIEEAKTEKLLKRAAGHKKPKVLEE